MSDSIRRKKTSGAQVIRYEYEIDKEIISSFELLGLSANASKILNYIYRAGKAQIYDFEVAFTISKSKVGFAIKELKGYDWIKEGKGDTDYEYQIPITLYSLKISLKKIIDDLDRIIQIEFDEQNAIFKKLLLRNDYKEIVDDLIKQGLSLGLKKNSSKILACLNNRKEATFNEIRKITGLNQSEVSIAMKELKFIDDWITERNENDGKGRIHKIFSLKIGFYGTIKNLKKKKMNEAKKHIKRLRKLLKWRWAHPPGKLTGQAITWLFGLITNV